MKNNQNTLKRVIFVSILMLCLVLPSIAICLNKKIVLSGKVVAYENSGLRIAHLTDILREEIFYVKVEKIQKGKEDSKYIKVRYSYRGEKSDLPENLLEGKNLWKFVLFRDKECDQVGIIKNSPISLIKIDENEELPQDTNIPCYLLVKEKIKAIEN